MRTIDPGHKYAVTSYDGGGAQEIVFMKREGEGYPGNVGHYPGTNCQELLRVLIDRITYLNGQIPHPNNGFSIQKLKEVLWLFEERAAQRHGEHLEFTQQNIHDAEPCLVCGHVVCHGHT